MRQIGSKPDQHNVADGKVDDDNRTASQSSG